MKDRLQLWIPALIAIALVAVTCAALIRIGQDWSRCTGAAGHPVYDSGHVLCFDHEGKLFAP